MIGVDGATGGLNIAVYYVAHAFPIIPALLPLCVEAN